MSNYPPGTYQADPNAPWNVPDPWVGQVCGDCKHFKPVCTIGQGRLFVCTVEGQDELMEVCSGETACEYFER